VVGILGLRPAIECRAFAREPGLSLDVGGVQRLDARLEIGDPLEGRLGWPLGPGRRPDA
jgi:hypothetical protein